VYNNLKYEIKDNIAYVTITKEKSLNALSKELLEELLAVFQEINSDEEVRAVILTGAGRAFAAGADISQMVNLTGIEGHNMMVRGAEVMDYIENVKKPVIAAVNGFALGGGCELAMACDIRIASTKSKFGQPEVGLGITPGFGGTQRLPRIVGVGKAKELIYTCDIIKADEALKIGLVNKVVEPEVLLEEAKAMAKKIAQNAPIAVKLCKDAINRGMQVNIDDAIDIEAYDFGKCFSTKDQKEGMTAFIERREKNFQNK